MNNPCCHDIVFRAGAIGNMADGQILESSTVFKHYATTDPGEAEFV